MLGAMSEVGLVVRLHKLGLLPEANRKTFVKTITEYAVEGRRSVVHDLRTKQNL